MVEKNPYRKTRTTVRRKGMLMRKLLRDVRENSMQFIAMMLLCFLGTWVFSGLDGTWRLMDRTVETYFAECNLADFWVSSSAVTKQDVLRIQHTPDVEEVQSRTSLTVDVEGLGDGVEAALEIYEGDFRLNQPYLRSGTMLKASDTKGCLIEEQFAQAHGLKIGDTVTLNIAGQRMHFRIRGMALSPEYTITSKEIVPDPQHYGFIFLSHRAVPDLPYTSVLVKLSENASIDAVRTSIEAAVPSAIVVSTATHKNISMARNYATMFHGMTYVFPVLAYSVAALIVVTTLKRMIDKERLEIGTLKALGYTSRRIRDHYLWYALLPSAVGSLIGLYVGRYTVPDVLWNMMAHNSRYPYVLRAPISPAAYGMTVLSVLLSIAICQFTLRASLKEQTADLMRQRPPKGGTRVLLERWKGLWCKLSFNSKMIIRNLMRNRGRTVIVLVGIVCCNMLIISTFGLKESLTFFMRQYYGGTLSYDYRVDLKPELAGTLESYQKRLKADTIEGVMDLNVSLHGEVSARACLLTVLKDEQTIIRLTADQKVLPMPDRDLVISRKLASVMGISPGDTVQIYLPDDTTPLNLKVAGFADTSAAQGLFMSETAWKTCRKGDFHVTSLLLRAPDGFTLHKIAEMDEVDSIHELEDQFTQGMTILDATATAFSILSGAALGLAFVICYNMGLMNFTERVRDYATLKVLGYHQREIRSLMLRESDLTALMGVLLGIAPGIVLVGIILKTCEFESMVFVRHVSLRSVLLASVITYVFSLFVEWLLTLKVRKIDMVEALKSVE